MLATTCTVPRVWAHPGLAARPVQQRQPCRLPRQALHTLAFKDGAQGSNGSGSKLAASSDHVHASKMINLCLDYFNELMTNGNTEAAHHILAANVAHKDMVRNEGRFGIAEYEGYIRDLKKAYPNIYVKPTQFGVVNNHTLFVAFEGRATPETPLFKGVDLFYFNDTATKIREVEVYRSNWLGAQGHEERKRAAQQHARQPHLTT